MFVVMVGKDASICVVAHFLLQKLDSLITYVHTPQRGIDPKLVTLNQV